MILEVAILDVKPGKQRQFEKDFAQASQYITSIEGYVRHSLRKCVEKDNRYILLVDWEELRNHVVGFRQSDVYQEWKKLLHPYYDPFPTVEHFETVMEHTK